MRHLAFLRVYQPLEKLPERIQDLARDAASRSSADIEAEAAERLNRRLRPESDSTFPNSSEPPIVRFREWTDHKGREHQFFHVEYLARPAFESTSMRRKYYDDALYARWVPQQQLDTLEKISELQADAGLISRPVSTFSWICGRFLCTGSRPSVVLKKPIMFIGSPKIPSTGPQLSVGCAIPIPRCHG